MHIDYKIDEPTTMERFRDLLESSTLGARRPVDDEVCLEGMIANSNLTVSAWDHAALVGIARSMTDFHYACYLSDSAVSKPYQIAGIGKQLQIRTQQQLGPQCTLILLAAPAANSYYEHIGYTNNPRCWVLDRNARIGD